MQGCIMCNIHYHSGDKNDKIFIIDRIKFVHFSYLKTKRFPIISLYISLIIHKKVYIII